MPGGEEKSENFYAVLGLKSDCTASELRNAYKKLAMRWHPDRWSASGNAKLAEESKKKFQAIQEAYSVLSDDNKRFLYDAGVYEDDDDDGMRDFLGEMMVMMNESKAQTSESDSFEDLQGLFMEMFEGDLNEFDNKPSMNSNCGSKRNCCGSVRMEDMGDCSFMMGVGSSFTVQSFSLGVHVYDVLMMEIMVLRLLANGDGDNDSQISRLLLGYECLWTLCQHTSCVLVVPLRLGVPSKLLCSRMRFPKVVASLVCSSSQI